MPLVDAAHPVGLAVGRTQDSDLLRPGSTSGAFGSVAAGVYLVTGMFYVHCARPWSTFVVSPEQ